MFAADAAVVNPNGIKMLLANGLRHRPRSLARNPLDYTILY